MKCSTCKAEITKGTRFCKACGNPVSFDPTLEDLYFSRLAGNAPPLLVEKVRSASYLAKERRVVTAILISLANIETFREKNPQEAQSTILNQALEIFSKVIFEFEGVIAKLWQNSILIFFGSPITHEDDPQRAIHAAQSILDETAAFRKDIKATYHFDFDLKIILNTGPVLIGEIKPNLKFNFKSLNNTLECMDLAIRAAVPVNKIILFEDTFRFIKPFVKCEALDPIHCEDIQENLHLWQVERINHQPMMMQKIKNSPSPTLIGREKELSLLLELSETVLAGLGRVGVILGEPGIGKSRLIAEWKRKLKNLHQASQIRWVQARGIAFGRELAYHLLKDLMKAALGTLESNQKQDLKKALRTALDDMKIEETEILYRYLAHLLEIELPEAEEKIIHQLNAHELQSQYHNAVRTFLRNIAREQPLIIILEDLHWADASSIAILKDLLSISTTTPTLFCLVSRIDREANGWQVITAAREEIGPRLTEMTLENLDEQESQALVNAYVQLEEIPETIKKVVLEKSEGNPYFIEELMRMLINEGILVQRNNRWHISPQMDTLKIPDSLQGLLTARIDRLPPQARLTLRVASVIGRNFPEQVIEDVLTQESADIELLEQLSTLESIGMIKVSKVKPELVYIFQHILIHEAAYHSIFESDRAKLHLVVGQTLEKRYPDQLERLASQLAHHFMEGGNKEKAYFYLDLAGHEAIKAYANSEAETCFKHAIQITTDETRLAHLYTDLGEALAQQNKHRQAIRAWKSAIDYLKSLKNFDQLAKVYAWSARSAWWGYDPKRSLEICLEGLEAVQGAIESANIASLIHETGRAYLFNDDPEKARSYCEQALEMARRLDAYDVQAESLATIGILPTIKPQQAIAALETAVKISESHHLFGPASRAYINLAAIIDNLGEIRLARDYRIRAIKLGHKSGGGSDNMLINLTITNASLWLAEFEDAQKRIRDMRQSLRTNEAYLEANTLNLLYLDGLSSKLKGDFTLAIEIFTDLIDRSRQINDVEHILRANQALSEIILEPYLLGQTERTTSNIDIALSMIVEITADKKNGQPLQTVASQCLISNIYAIKGSLSQAENALEVANNIYRNQPSMQDRVRIVLAQARIEAARGHFESAFSHYDKALKMLERMEGRWWYARITVEQGILLLKRNDPEDVDQAQGFFREALSEFKALAINYYPDVIIEKLREVKKISRAQAIAHRKITRELAEAGRIQNTIIPTKSPDIPGYQISGVLLPARETSGDFFDFFNISDDQQGFVIADVGDKGAGAALYMAMSRTLIRTYAVESKLQPEEVIQQVNRRILTDTERGIFLTVIFGILNSQNSIFTFVNAGHNPPYHIQKHNDRLELIALDKTGTLVGIFKENKWKADSIDLAPGDYLVLYTDGVTEAQNENGDFFGNERLFQFLRENAGKSAETFRNLLLEKVQQFIGSGPRLDDITLIIIHRENESQTGPNS